MAVVGGPLTRCRRAAVVVGPRSARRAPCEAAAGVRRAEREVTGRERRERQRSGRGGRVIAARGRERSRVRYLDGCEGVHIAVARRDRDGLGRRGDRGAVPPLDVVVGAARGQRVAVEPRPCGRHRRGDGGHVVSLGAAADVDVDQHRVADGRVRRPVGDGCGAARVRPRPGVACLHDRRVRHCLPHQISVRVVGRGWIDARHLCPVAAEHRAITPPQRAAVRSLGLVADPLPSAGRMVTRMRPRTAHHTPRRNAARAVKDGFSAA